MTILRAIIGTFLLLLIAVPVATAQDETGTHPLFEMLARVPDTAEGRGGVMMYADIRAAEVARGLPAFTSHEVWNAAEVLGAQRLWLFSLPHTLPQDFAQQFFIVVDEMPRLLGFEIFDIDRTMTFNNPPSVGNIIQGRFDADAIDAALLARDYTRGGFGDVLLWCGPDGCDSGLNVDIAGREPGNPFGGNLGRVEPFSLLDGYFLNSADFAVLEQIADAALDRRPSLSDAPDYRAAAQAITQRGLLRGAMFVNPLEAFGANPFADLLSISGLTEEQIAALQAQFGLDDESFVPVGLAAELVVIADLAFPHESQGRQSATIGLVYRDEDTANAALEELTARLAEPLPSLAFGDGDVTIQDLIDSRNATLQPPRLFNATEDGRVVLLLEMNGDLIRGNAENDDGFVIQSGLLFRLWQDMFFRRDLLWLA